MTPDQAAMLIRIDQKLNDMSNNNTEEHLSIKKQQAVIDGRLNETKKDVFVALNNRPRWNVIMWLLGGVFLVLVAVAGFTYRTDVKLTTHIEISKQVFHQLTGIEFDNRDGSETVKDDAD